MDCKIESNSHRRLGWCEFTALKIPQDFVLTLGETWGFASRLID